MRRGRRSEREETDRKLYADSVREKVGDRRKRRRLVTKLLITMADTIVTPNNIKNMFCFLFFYGENCN